MNNIIIDKYYLDVFREVINKKLGIYISKNKNYFLESKLKRLLKNQINIDITELYNFILNNDSKYLDNLINQITINHTFFFREKNHYKKIAENIKKENIKKPLIWCTACSTGEEVYSLIMELLENKINNFLIVASDINRDVLFNLKKGRYISYKLKNVKKHIRNKYFIKEDISGYEYYTVKQYLKNYFIVKKLNLIDPVIFEKNFDYILCKNVLIYFNIETRRMVIKNLLNNLKENGLLFLGYSETLLNMRDMVEQVDPSIYRKKQS